MVSAIITQGALAHKRKIYSSKNEKRFLTGSSGSSKRKKQVHPKKKLKFMGKKIDTN